MFAFQKWSSAAEMRRYSMQFMHLLPGLQKLGGIIRTVYNQYDSIIVPLQKWLVSEGVNFDMGVKVEDIDFNIGKDEKTATAIHYIEDGQKKAISLNKNNYVFMTNGSIVDSTDTGSMTKPAILKAKETSGSWMLWDKIAKKDPTFGNPGVFSDQIDLQKWESFTVKLTDQTFFCYMSEEYGYIPGVGGLITITDSN